MEEIEFVKLPVYFEKKITEDAENVADVMLALQQADDIDAIHNRDQLIYRMAAHALGVNDDIPSQRIAISCSCEDLYDLPNLSEKDIRNTAYRLAANKADIQKGWAAPPNPDVVKLYTATGEIVGVRKNESKRKGELQLGIKLLTGKLAGKVYLHNCSWKTGTYLYGICTGFPRKASYQSPKQLVGLRLGVSIGWETNDFVLERFVISKSLRSDNTKLARSRIRDLANCPFNLQIDCLFCRVGRNECPTSVNTKPTQLIKKRTDA